jgi:predicted metal-dependent hydrolase
MEIDLGKNHLQAEGEPLEETENGVDGLYYIERRSRRIRRLSISVDASCNVIVRVPEGASGREIHDFILRNRKWIDDSVSEMAAAERITIDGRDGSTAVFGGSILQVEVSAQSDGRHYALAENGRKLKLFVEEGEADGRQTLGMFYAERTLDFLKRKIPEWERATGLRGAKYEIKDFRSRWGSCSAGGTIRFSARLSIFPEDVMEYVVVHELCHLRHRRHDKRFWKTVARFMPDYMDRRAELRRWALRIHFPG